MSKTISNQNNTTNFHIEHKAGSVWFNIYSSECMILHNSKEEADECAYSNRLACVELKWTEGEGLIE